MHPLTLAERERLAYAEGFTTTAALLAQAKQCEPTKTVLARSIFK